MKHELSPDDRELLAGFLSQQLPLATFHHREHVRLAYIFIIEHGAEQAYAAFRDGLQALLRHHGVDPARYHATLTQAWLLAVQHFMACSAPAGGSVAFLAANPRLLDPTIMLTHYSQQLIMSDRARSRLVVPDMQPIPHHTGAQVVSGAAR